MVRVCGMLGSRVCGLLGSVCGSVGLAVLVVALAAMATRHAYAEDPVPVPIGGPSCTQCTTLCVGQIGAQCDEAGQNTANCSAACFCEQDPVNPNVQPHCRPIF
jgi:hypothetical protein